MDALAIVSTLPSLQGEVKDSRITDDMRRDWRMHPVTREFLLEMKTGLLEGMSAWASGEFQQQTPQETAVKNSKALAGVELLVSIIEKLEGE